MLFVVDDPHAGRLYQAFFAEQSVDVVVATNAHAALALAVDEVFDLVFVDLTRGANATLQFARRLRRERSADELYVLVAADPRGGVDGLSLVANEWIGRPVSLASLDEAVRRAFAEAPAPELGQVVSLYEASQERGRTGEPRTARRSVTQPMDRLTVAQRHIIDMQHRFSQQFGLLKKSG